MIQTSVVLFSGGPDSTAAALWAREHREHIRLVSFQFRGRAQYGELAAAIQIAAFLGLDHTIIDFKSPMDAYDDGVHILMHAGDAVEAPSVDRSRMPYAAGIILSVAASWSMYEGCPELVWGATLDDGLATPTYSQGFSDELAALISSSTGSNFSITAPFAQKHKPEVMLAYLSNADLFALTWSCKSAGTEQCGSCQACLAKMWSAAMIGLQDRSHYQASDFGGRYGDSIVSDATRSHDEWTRLIGASTAVRMESPK